VTVKTPELPQAVYSFNVILIKISMTFIEYTEKLILKFIWLSGDLE
jgi:hypothetical protein